MLKLLTITDFALIKNISIEFGSGLNILLGETGAGKSIIADALLLALGERASTDDIRSGSSKAIIEADFELDAKHPSFEYLKLNDIDFFDNTIKTRREVSLKGHSRCFINDSLVQVALLKGLGDLLVDFHGQHDHQILLKQENHIQFIDLFANNKDLSEKYKSEFAEHSALLKRYRELCQREKELKFQQESYQFELNEINKINPELDEDIKIESELKILENSELLLQLSSELAGILNNSDNSVLNNLQQALKAIDKLSGIDPSFSSYSQELNSVKISLQEISTFAADYKDTIELNPDYIETLRERLFLIKGLKKKYGSLDTVFERIDYLKSNLALAENFDEEIRLMQNQIIDNQKLLGNIAASLSDNRKKSALKFEKQIIHVLKDLNLPNIQFKVQFSYEEFIGTNNFEITTCIINNQEIKCFENGIDIVEFFISTNLGEEPKALANIASGGEISRIMLGIKSIIADSDNMPVLIFDEIDTGISGKVARMVGNAMKNLALTHQIIAITHLVQIAALGDRIISVRKTEQDFVTSINVEPIEDNGRKMSELAKLISGETVTDAALQTVNELLNRN